MDETYKVKFIKYNCIEGHIDYIIKVMGSRSTKFYLQDRYSEIRSYWLNMLKEYNESIPPTFPPKKWFGNTDEEFIRQRMDELGGFFNTVLADPKLASCELTKNYFKEKKIKYNEEAQSEGKEEIKQYVEPLKTGHEKEWKESVNTVTNSYIDINFGEDPPAPEEVKKKSLRYSEVLSESLNSIPYMTNIVELPKGNEVYINEKIGRAHV